MLDLDRVRSADLVFPVDKWCPVREPVIIVVGLDLLGLEPVVPGKEQRGLGTAVILDVTLATGERAHFLAAGQRVGIIGLGTIAGPPLFDRRQVRQRVVAGGQRGNAVEETRSRDPQLHRLRVVTIETGDRVFHAPGCLVVWLGGDDLETFHQLRQTGRAEQRVDE